MAVPELDEEDQKSYDTIKKIIQAGQVESLKMDECKVYLRKHGLRLSGTKETLILRIKEHIDITTGGGEKLYPASSFAVNCKGDACVGDIVLFKQKVNEVSGGPLGTRVVAGRIVKESYGAAKQQHTFTIEVLWSKGKKPLPPLHPLLIKGRNLYRLKTMRQKWEDEEERLNILSEKHARGDVARLQREARIKQREMRKILKQTRKFILLNDNVYQGNTRWTLKQKTRKQRPLHSLSLKPARHIKQPKQQHQDPTNTLGEQLYTQEIHHYPRACEASFPIQPKNLHRKPHGISNAHMPAQGLYLGQPLHSLNCSFPRDQHGSLQSSNFHSSRSINQAGYHKEQHKNYRTTRNPAHFATSNHLRNPYQVNVSNENWSHPSHSQQSHAYIEQGLNAAENPPFEREQTCLYYTQGRCFYGDRCKYLHI